MNLTDIYAFFPEDMHGSIAVAADAVSITQADAPPFILYRSAPHDAAELSLSPVAPAPLDEDVKYYLDQELRAKYIADLMSGGLRTEPTPPTAPPVDPQTSSLSRDSHVTVPPPVLAPGPEPAPKLSLFQRLTNFFTRSK